LKSTSPFAPAATRRFAKFAGEEKKGDNLTAIGMVTTWRIARTISMARRSTS